MQKIHNKLKEKSKRYSDWHENPHHQKVHWGATVAVALIVGLLVLKGIGAWRDTIYNVVVIEFSPRAATLTLDPKTKSVKVGDFFVVNIILDTAGKAVDGVDVYSLHYDPTILNVIDDVSSKPGIQITPSALMEITAMNSVNQSTGTIKFGQVAQVGADFSGKEVLASVHFKAVGKGNTYLKFDFKLGSTTDTNVAHAGRDRLMNVVDALYTVTAK